MFIFNFGYSQDYERLCNQFEKANQEMKKGEYDLALESLGEIELGFAKLGYWNDWYSCIAKHYLIGKKKNLNSTITVLQRNELNATKCYMKWRAIFYDIYAISLYRLNRISECIPKSKLSLNCHKKLDNNRKINRALKNLSVYYAFFNDHESAIKYIQALLDNIDNEAIDQKIDLLFTLSQYYFNAKKFDASLETINQVIDFKDKDLQSQLLQKAQILTSLQKFDEANDILDKLSIQFKAKDETKPIVASIFEKQGKLKEAKAIRFEAAKKLEQSSPNDRYYAIQLAMLANLHFQLEEYEEALVYSHKVIMFFCKDFNDSNLLSSPSKNQLIPEAYLMEVLSLKAKIIEKQNSQNKATHEVVYKNYDLSFEVLDLLRKQYAEIESKHQMTEEAYNLFSSSIGYSINNYGVKNDQYFLDKAFEYSQLSKAFTLREAISEREAMKNAGVNKKEIDYYLNFKSRTLDNHLDYVSFRDSLQNIKNSIHQKYAALLKEEDSKILTIGQVQENLKENQILLHYFQTNKDIVCFAIDKNKSFLLSQDIDSTFENHVLRYFDILKDPFDYKEASAMFFENSKVIFEKTLSSVLEILKGKNINHLIIVPDGILYNVFFSNLPMYEKNSWEDPASSVISEYAVSYLHFTDELKHFSSQNNRINHSVSIGLDYEKSNEKLAFENSKKYNYRNSTDEFLLSPLKFAKKEALEISEKIDSDLLLNEEASVQNVKGKLSQSDLIHYAGHCVIDQEDYANSFIPIFKEKDQLYKLDYPNIQALNIQPKLVVLSACNTSNGKAIKTEGKFSMSRVFTNAGAKSVLGSNWNTPDEISYKLINLFYEKLIEGYDKAQALRLAQLEFLTNDKLSAPSERKAAFWSNWALHGDINSLTFKKHTSFHSDYFIPIFIIICILLTLVAWKTYNS